MVKMIYNAFENVWESPKSVVCLVLITSKIVTKRKRNILSGIIAFMSTVVVSLMIWWYYICSSRIEEYHEMCEQSHVISKEFCLSFKNMYDMFYE